MHGAQQRHDPPRTCAPARTAQSKRSAYGTALAAARWAPARLGRPLPCPARAASAPTASLAPGAPAPQVLGFRV
eukprot:365438-Chlamydomonas_euryale.AAC.8